MTQPQRFVWSYVPPAICAAVMLAGSILLVANLIFGALTNGRRIHLAPPLVGAVLPDTMQFSVGAILDGSYEAAFARQIAVRMPYYAPAVRLRDQLVYSLFGTSATQSVVVGKGLQLLEAPYIENYCTRRLAAFLDGAPAWAERVRQIQDKVEARRQTFLFVITPSKVAQYPQYLPDGLPCRSSLADRTGVVPAALDLLRKAGVHVVDTTSILSAAHAAYPFPLYSRGGTHWNEVGGALASQAVEAELEKVRQDQLFRPFSFTWQMSSHPALIDVDLALLMNLIWLPDHFEVPKITVTQAPRAQDCRPVHITIVGGSFMHNIGEALSDLPCGAKAVEYEYWSIYRLEWTAGVLTFGHGVDPPARDADLMDADVVLYEENEILLARSKLSGELLQWLGEHPAKD